MDSSCIVTPEQIRQKEQEYRHWSDYFAKIRTQILAKAFPEVIFISNDGNILYKYSQTIENILKKIDETEEIVMKRFL